MATRINFREKFFAGAWDMYRKHAPALISTAALGVSAANYAANRRRIQQAEKYNKQQLTAMSNLTQELKNTAKSMHEVGTSMREGKPMVIVHQNQEQKKRKGLFRK